MNDATISIKQSSPGRIEAIVMEGGLITDKFRGASFDNIFDYIKHEYPHATIENPSLHATEPWGNPHYVTDYEINQMLIEIEEDRRHGRLLPFIEGQPIGSIPPAKRADLKPKPRKRTRR